MITRLAHLCFMSHQLPAMLAFYRDGLGLTVKFALRHDDGTVFGYYLAAGHTTFVEIFDRAGAVKQWGGENLPLRPHSGTHYNHSCFEVTGIEAYCVRLQSLGIAVKPVKVGMDHSKQAWVSDPDGNVIELMEYTRRSLQLSPD